MPANYVLLERIELNASAASVTFSNIPQTGYTDLKLVLSSRGSTTSGAGRDVLLCSMQFNGSASTYTTKFVRTTGSTASSTGGPTGGYVPASSFTANCFSNTEIYIPNYTSSNQKSFSVDSVSEQNVASWDTIMGFGACLWNGTAAISSIAFTLDYGSFVSGSTFSLYGLAAVGSTPAIAPKASGGNRIDYDGTYWIHTFTTSGTFVPSQTLSCDYLVVAGGGGGSYSGGGAGGLRSTVTATGGGGTLETAVSLATSTNYTITIGGGGSGSSTAATNGVSSSIIGGVVSVSTVGGGGSTVSGLTYGSSGGSGGAGGGAGGTGGAGTTNQGYAGGAGASGASAGGGGAGAIGANAGTNAGGNGGAGVSTSITGTSVAYAGGGGGSGSSTQGTGGSGGGGNASGSTGASGTTNTGGGAGGGGGGTGGNGGSGVVIIRYLAA